MLSILPSALMLGMNKGSRLPERRKPGRLRRSTTGSIPTSICDRTKAARVHARTREFQRDFRKSAKADVTPTAVLLDSGDPTFGPSFADYQKKSVPTAITAVLAGILMAMALSRPQAVLPT